MTSEVNTWPRSRQLVLSKTCSLLGLLIAQPGSFLLMIKGAWANKFDPLLTKVDDFYLPDGNLVKVPFMTSKKEQFIRAFDGFKVLCLPYEQGQDEHQFSMYLFLPDAKNGLPALIRK